MLHTRIEMASHTDWPYGGLKADTADVTWYRWEPRYTNARVSLNPLFRPTGGNLVFRMRPDEDNLERKVMGSEFKDVLTLNEVRAILNNDTRNKATKIYRPSLQDTNGRIMPERVALALRPFGVTSVSMISRWTSDLRVSAQPVVIFGAPVCDKSNYATYDALRIPTELVEMNGECTPDNQRAYLYMTLKKIRGGWDLKFVMSPFVTYRNAEMMADHGFSLTYKLGIVDYLNRGPKGTDIFMAVNMTGMGPNNEDAGSKWYFEGFVYHPNKWVMYYKESPSNFYGRFAETGRFNDLFALDPSRRIMIKHRAMVTKKDGVRRPPKTTTGGKRRFHGGGVSTGVKAPRLQDNLPGRSGVINGKQFTPLNNTRHYDPQPPPQGNPALIFSDSGEPTKKMGGADMQAATAYFGTNPDKFNKDLLASITLMIGRTGITLPWLTKGVGVTVASGDIFVILGLAFLGRLKIDSAKNPAIVARSTKQINLSKLAKWPEKLKSAVCYFVTCMKNLSLLTGGRSVTFYHKSGATVNHQAVDANPVIAPVEMLADGPKIEDVIGAVKADFANKAFGGSVTDSGAMHEEILIMTHFETMLGRALFPDMETTSSIHILGALKFCNYLGYSHGANGFAFSSPSDPVAQAATLDTKGRAVVHEIVAFDAVSYKDKSRPRARAQEQYRPADIAREYNKAKGAFEIIAGNDAAVSTGRWGSGDFRGDPLLKVLLQVVAASAMKRESVFVMLDSKPLVTVAKRVVDIATAMNMSAIEMVKELTKALNKNNPFPGRLPKDKTDQDFARAAIEAHFESLYERRGTPKPAAAQAPPQSPSPPPSPTTSVRADLDYITGQ